LTERAVVTPEYMRAWGEHAGSSPLYRELVEVIAESDELLRIVNRIPHKPPPNILFAAVQFLLMDGMGADLARYYPSLTESPLPATEAGPVFTEFVIDHEDPIVAIGTTRYTQTNECRRCVALLPGIWAAPFDRFHLIDLGASAGLNLALDHYRYRWGEVGWGRRSPVLLETELRLASPTPRDITVLSRTGLDLSPVDVSDPVERRWLEALIWPEQRDRRERLHAALEVAGQVERRMVGGSALDTLGLAFAGLPGEEPAVVMNSFALNQLSEEERAHIDWVVSEARAVRSVHRVSMELRIRDDRSARIEVDDGSGWAEIGRAQPHGEWLELYARP